VQIDFFPVSRPGTVRPLTKLAAEQSSKPQFADGGVIIGGEKKPKAQLASERTVVVKAGLNISVA
jgi:hypothetical protein